MMPQMRHEDPYQLKKMMSVVSDAHKILYKRHKQAWADLKESKKTSLDKA